MNGKIRPFKENKPNYSPVLDWCAWSSIVTAILITIQSSWDKQERDEKREQQDQEEDNEDGRDWMVR